MGRRKIEIQPITHERNRSVTFLKRKNGLFKKAYELGVLCAVDVAVIIFNPAGTNNKLFEYTSTDLDSIIRRRAEFQGERDLKTPHDYTHDGLKPNAGKLNGIGGGGDSDDDDDDSDHVSPSQSKGPGSSKRKFAGTKSRPAKKGGLDSLLEEKQEPDELENDSALSRRSPKTRGSPPSDDERERHGKSRNRRESGDSSKGYQNGPSSSRDGPRTESDSWLAPNRSSSAHDILLGGGGSSLANLGLPLQLGHLTPQQLSILAPQLSNLASQQSLSALTPQQIASLTPQQQELLALHAMKQQQQQLHLHQREQLASLQNTLRNNPNRLGTLNINLTGLGNLGNLGSLGSGGLGSLGNLGSLGGLGGGRDFGGLGLGNTLNGLPIRKLGLNGNGIGSGFPSFYAPLSSISSSGIAGAGNLGHGHSLPNTSNIHSPNHPSLSNNLNSPANGIPANDQFGSAGSVPEDGSWLDFLSLPSSSRGDQGALSGLGALGGLGIGNLVDRERESATRATVNDGHSGSSSLFDFHVTSSNGHGESPGGLGNSGFSGGVASGGGYGLGLGLSAGDKDRAPSERSPSRNENMDIDKDRLGTDHEKDPERSASAISVDSSEHDRDEDGRSRKRPRWG